MTARNEQETTVTAGRDDEWVFVWTNNPVHARRLDADDRAVLVTQGMTSGVSTRSARRTSTRSRDSAGRASL